MNGDEKASKQDAKIPEAQGEASKDNEEVIAPAEGNEEDDKDISKHNIVTFQELTFDLSGDRTVPREVQSGSMSKVPA